MTATLADAIASRDRGNWSKSGRSVDVRRIYHRDTKPTPANNGARMPMRAWARKVAATDDPNYTVVRSWLAGKGVRL